MDQQKRNIAIGVAIVVGLIAIWWFFFRKPSVSGGAKKKDSAAGEKVTIYGSLGCPYTVKQMEKYPNHEFVDCTSTKCPDFVTAYPTTKMADGRIEVGFS